MKSIGQKTAEALELFLEQLKANEPMRVTILTRESTPDGPLTERHHVTMRPSEMGPNGFRDAIEGSGGK